MTEKKNKEENKDDVVDTLEEEKREKIQGVVRPAGHYSNSIIRKRNGGVRHQFENDIGGCGDNYR